MSTLSRSSKPKTKQAEEAEAAYIIEETAEIVAVGVCVGADEVVVEVAGVLGVLRERFTAGIATMALGVDDGAVTGLYLPAAARNDPRITMCCTKSLTCTS